MKKVYLSKNDFERVIHGNRSIPNNNYKIGDIVRFFCTDAMYSYPIDAKIRYIIVKNDTVKTYPGYRTNDFPF